MGNKNYSEFPPGTYDPTKILLQANPTTGALEKVELPTINQFLKAAANKLDADGSIDLNGNALLIPFNPGTSDSFIAFGTQGGQETLVAFLGSFSALNTSISITPETLIIKTSDDLSESALRIEKDRITFEVDADQYAVAELFDGMVSFASEAIDLSTQKLTIQNIADHPSNAAAITAGLVTDQVYRQGDLLAIVH